MKKRIIVIKMIIAQLIAITSVSPASQAKPLPMLNLEAIHSHQKELMGNKKSFTKEQIEKEADLINRAIANLVYEETRNSLPEKYKKNAARISKTIIEEANKYEFDPLFLIAVIKHESYFSPEMIGSFQEVGLMQIKPSTAEWLNKSVGVGLKSIDLKDPAINIKLGAAFFNQLRAKFGNDSRLYIAAYNMGAANVRKLLKNNKKPKEYAVKVMKNYIELVETVELNVLKNSVAIKVATNN